MLNKRQGQSGSYCLILDLKASKELLLFMAAGNKDPIIGAKKYIVSVAYFTVFGFLHKVYCVNFLVRKKQK